MDHYIRANLLVQADLIVRHLYEQEVLPRRPQGSTARLKPNQHSGLRVKRVSLEKHLARQLLLWNSPWRQVCQKLSIKIWVFTANICIVKSSDFEPDFQESLKQDVRHRTFVRQTCGSNSPASFQLIRLWYATRISKPSVVPRSLNSNPARITYAVCSVFLLVRPRAWRPFSDHGKCATGMMKKLKGIC